MDLTLDSIKKAIEFDSTSFEHYFFAATVLSDQGMKKKNTELLGECFKMYEKAASLTTLKQGIIYNDWGASYIRLGKIRNNINSYKAIIEEYCSKAVELGDNAGYYNLSCLYSLLNKRKEAIQYLEKYLITNKRGNENYSPRSDLESDTDFDNLRKTSSLINC